MIFHSTVVGWSRESVENWNLMKLNTNEGSESGSLCVRLQSKRKSQTQIKLSLGELWNWFKSARFVFEIFIKLYRNFTEFFVGFRFGEETTIDVEFNQIIEPTLGSNKNQAFVGSRFQPLISAASWSAAIDFLSIGRGQFALFVNFSSRMESDGKLFPLIRWAFQTAAVFGQLS